MRARSLKPSIFKNEYLAVADPLFTLIFEGLWCAADREGRLEDRPGKIHMEINPGRAFEGTERSLEWLAEHGFIDRYEVAGKKYIQVVAFAKHQKPHVNEKPSAIPPRTCVQGTKSEQPINGHVANESAAKVASEHNQGGKHLALTPDSGLLTPDSLIPTAASRPRDRRGARFEEWFGELRDVYPKRAGSQPWTRAQRAANARISEGHRPQEFIDGAKRYAAFCRATGKIGTETVMQAATFLGPDKEFLNPYSLPETPATLAAERRQAADVRALAELKSRAERIGFRAFTEQDDLLGYKTLLERFESNQPRRASQ
jgi:hypothetical protein